MELLIQGLVYVFAFLVALFFIRRAINERISRKMNESVDEMVGAITAHFRKMEEAYKTASVDEVNQRIQFLESLIEAGFTQYRDRVEKLENIEKARMRDLENALNETRSVQS